MTHAVEDDEKGTGNGGCGRLVLAEINHQKD
jgi:hypothetical protein